MINHEPEREKQLEQERTRETEKVYCRSIASRLRNIREIEQVADKQARKRTGIIDVARLYGRKEHEIDPAFNQAMQRLWDIGTFPEGKADTELRRPYHLIAKGKAPLTEADVIRIARMSDTDLCRILPWLAHRLSLVEALDHLDLGEMAPPVVVEEEAR